MQRKQDGFTIIEVLVATLVLTLAALATFGLLSSATKNTQRAKATQVALDRAQQELEALRSLTPEERALTSSPPDSADPLNPGYRVNDSNGTFALTREPPAEYKELVVNGGYLYDKETGKTVSGGVISPGPTPFTSGDVTGEVYRYVVWRDDVTCGTGCPGPQDYKQIIIAVKLDTPGNQAGERGYVEVQSNFIDPTDSAENDPVPDSEGKVVTAQQFYLSDTPCATNGEPARQAITADHLLHNTLGICENGLQTGSTTKGAPDALLLGAPPDSAPEDENLPPLYDYADDSYLEPTPDTDKGLQIRKDDTAGCNYVPTGTTNPESQVHRWVTPKMESDFTMTDKVTIEFYTRALNDVSHRGEICVYLFKRHEVGSPVVTTDTLLTDGATNQKYWTYTDTSWPEGVWEGVRLKMEVAEAPYTIPAGDRLGVALSVERAGTSSFVDAIPVMYDHPDHGRTRIEVDTNTPIEGG